MVFQGRFDTETVKRMGEIFVDILKEKYPDMQLTLQSETRVVLGIWYEVYYFRSRDPIPSNGSFDADEARTHVIECFESGRIVHNNHESPPIMLAIREEFNCRVQRSTHCLIGFIINIC